MQNQSKLKLPNGATIQHGMLWADPRNGAPKKLTVPKISPGMKSQTRSGGVHAYLHGQCQDDSVPAKTYTTVEVPLHPATPNPEPLCAFAPHLHPVRRAGTSSTRGKADTGGREIGFS
jgi:hypothetical protein